MDFELAVGEFRSRDPHQLARRVRRTIRDAVDWRTRFSIRNRMLGRIRIRHAEEEPRGGDPSHIDCTIWWKDVHKAQWWRRLRKTPARMARPVVRIDIDYLYVRQEWRRRGMGRQLMRSIIDAVGTDMAIQLSVAPFADESERGMSFERLHAWYRSFGFETLSGFGPKSPVLIRPPSAR